MTSLEEDMLQAQQTPLLFLKLRNDIVLEENKFIKNLAFIISKDFHSYLIYESFLESLLRE